MLCIVKHVAVHITFIWPSSISGTLEYTDFNDKHVSWFFRVVPCTEVNIGLLNALPYGP